MHFYPLSFTFIHFHPLSSCFILFHPLSSTFVHIFPLSLTLTDFHPLVFTFVHFNPLLSTFIHFQPISSTCICLTKNVINWSSLFTVNNWLGCFCSPPMLTIHFYVLGVLAWYALVWCECLQWLLCALSPWRRLPHMWQRDLVSK